MPHHESSRLQNLGSWGSCFMQYFGSDRDIAGFPASWSRKNSGSVPLRPPADRGAGGFAEILPPRPPPLLGNGGARRWRTKVSRLSQRVSTSTGRPILAPLTHKLGTTTLIHSLTHSFIHPHTLPTLTPEEFARALRDRTRPSFLTTGFLRYGGVTWETLSAESLNEPPYTQRRPSQRHRETNIDRESPPPPARVLAWPC